MSLSLVSAGIIVGMALLYDADGTIKLVTIAIGIRGITWVAQKITASISLDASQMIDFTGWSMAGVSMIGVIKNAMGSTAVIRDFATNIANIVNNVAKFADKVVFWN